jgi:transposase
MSLVNVKSRLKNRIHATMAKYNLTATFSDPFGKKGREELRRLIKLLPEQTSFTTALQLDEVGQLDRKVGLIDERIKKVFKDTEELALLRSMPGVGFVLGIVILLEVGDVKRFHSAGALASYSGTTPRVHSSGGKTRHGQLRNDVNRYLKWAFVEAAGAVSIHRKARPDRYVSALYARMRESKGRQKTVGAVARRLAESAFWILLKKEEYRERGQAGFLPTKA